MIQQYIEENYGFKVHDEDSNSTKLTDATSGEPKTYSLEDGEYKIGISFSAGADLMFTLNPVTDKVGEDQTTKPTPPCTEHVDADGDGKCDNCGADMPTETPDEPELMLTMTATDILLYYNSYLNNLIFINVGFQSLNK